MDLDSAYLVSWVTFYYWPVFAFLVLCLYIFLDNNMNYERKCKPL